MKKVNIGIVGRGMVAQVALQLLQEQEFFEGPVSVRAYSESMKGTPPEGCENERLLDANNLDLLMQEEIIITFQGGPYTKKVYHQLREREWNGYWIDAASALRHDPEAILTLDPLNGDITRKAILDGSTKTFVGANCTTSILLMALAGLFRENLVEDIQVATSQAISGAGAAQVEELAAQLGVIHRGTELIQTGNALRLITAIQEIQTGGQLPTDDIGAVLANSLLPWIGGNSVDENGLTEEEAKTSFEAGRILGYNVPILATCTRVPVICAHSEIFFVRLKQGCNMSLEELTGIIARGHEWVNVVPNDKAYTLRDLTPVAVTGTDNIAVGRLRLEQAGPLPWTLAGICIGDQLRWGAATPLVRVLDMLVKHLAGVHA